MRVSTVWLEDFRNYEKIELALSPDGLTAVIGANGEGKTNLLEAIAFGATLKSFRGAPTEAIVRNGAERAIVRLEGEHDDRRLLIEVESVLGGRTRAQRNKQAVKRARDLREDLHVTVFAPDDLILVKGGPAERRGYVDDLLSDLHLKNDALQSDVDRVLRQRNTLLRQAGGRLTADVASTLDVWDTKLADTGTALTNARVSLIDQLEPIVGKAYDDLAATGSAIAMSYTRSYEGELIEALRAVRDDDVRRGITTVGPHRDDIGLRISGLPARNQASQGEQRTLALALRLAAHRIVTEETGNPPLLLLDDVFSELDPDRSDALIAHLPAGQAILTTAGPLPEAVHPDRTVRIREGRVVDAS